MLNKTFNDFISELIEDANDRYRDSLSGTEMDELDVSEHLERSKRFLEDMVDEVIHDIRVEANAEFESLIEDAYED